MLNRKLPSNYDAFIHSKFSHVSCPPLQVPPSPPNPPGLPPSPPNPPQSPSPRPPPPSIQYFERLRDAERDTDDNCELVEYAECAEIVRQFSANNRGYSSNLKVTTQHCEDTETEVCKPHHVETLLCSHPIEFVCVFCSQPDCFLGCAFGNRNGGTYRFLLPEVDNRFTKARCKLSIHPRCACRNSAIASRLNLQPPPPPAVYTEEWNIVQLPFLNPDGRARDTSRGAVGAMTQRLVNGRTLDLSLRSGPMHSFQCPLDDDGHETCALKCASEHLSRLRAFTVTGEK